MKLIVVANDNLKAELLQQGVTEPVTIEWANDIHDIGSSAADACIDLLFTAKQPKRIAALKQLPVKLVIVNDVIGTGDLPVSFVRINGWTTFLKRPVIEAATGDKKNKDTAIQIFNCFTKKIEWTTNTPGFITARIISMIINEAYFALEQQVSTKEEIDVAMKTGTNYPYGPFAWCHTIGINNVYELLQKLSRHDNRYQPAALLETEATT